MVFSTNSACYVSNLCYLDVQKTNKKEGKLVRQSIFPSLFLSNERVSRMNRAQKLSLNDILNFDVHGKGIPYSQQR